MIDWGWFYAKGEQDAKVHFARETLRPEATFLQTLRMTDAQRIKYQDVILRIEQRYDAVLARRS